MALVMRWSVSLQFCELPKQTIAIEPHTISYHTTIICDFTIGRYARSFLCFVVYYYHATWIMQVRNSVHL